MLKKKWIILVSVTLILMISSLAVIVSAKNGNDNENEQGNGDNRDDEHSGKVDKIGDGDSGQGNDDKEKENKDKDKDKEKKVKDKDNKDPDTNEEVEESKDDEGAEQKDEEDKQEEGEDEPPSETPLEDAKLKFSFEVTFVEAYYDHEVHLQFDSELGEDLKVKIDDVEFEIEDGQGSILVFGSSHEAVGKVVKISVEGEGKVEVSPFIFVKNTEVYIHSEEVYCKIQEDNKTAIYAFEDLKDSKEFENDWDYNDVILNIDG